MEKEADQLREVIQDKEAQIKAKEDEKARIKQTIEIENADLENEIQALRN